MSKQFSLVCSAILLLVARVATATPDRVAPEYVMDYWVLANSEFSASVPNTGQNLDVPVCASVVYTIGSDGITHDIKLGKVVPPSDLGKAAISIIEDYRYLPALHNPRQVPIRTWFTVQFNMRDLPEDEQDKRMAACDLRGFGQ